MDFKLIVCVNEKNVIGRNGNLLFNWRIVMAPSPVIDYIVVHEMSHLVHKNHSTAFWSLVENILPDYKERRKWLKGYGVRMDL